MTKLLVIADAGSIIALDRIGLLGQLEPLFDEFLMPPAVAQEIAPTVVAPDWMGIRSLSEAIDVRILAAGLGQGETEALSLAMELSAYQLIIDERAGRRLALDLGIRLTGTLGLLLAAKDARVIPAMRPHVQDLLATGFFASRVLVNDVPRTANEPPIEEG